MSDDLKGTVFNGRYTILDRIGAGGMATVYRARDEKTSAFVAIKILSRDFLARSPKEAERNLRRFKREAEILRILNGSEHVVGYTEHACSESGDWFIAMELLEGEQLRYYIGRGKSVMGVPTFLHYAMHLVAGLKEIHAKNIVHRDLAPDNVILVKNEEGILVPKFLDFGIGKSLGDELDQVTQMLTIMGKPQYFSPEQARGMDLTTASDVYSIGVLLYEMVTGHVPLEIHGIPDFRKIQKEPPLPVDGRREGQRIPEQLQQVIMRALAKMPEDRPLLDEIADVVMATRERVNAGEEFAPRAGDTKPTADHTTPVRITEVELQDGESVNRYQIKRMLGRGGMGAVYEAWDPDLHRKVALKVATQVEEERAKKDLLREARASAALRCENIVTIYDAGTEGGTPYIAMEFVEGKTLAEVIETEGPLKDQRFWDIARGMCEGLALAHDRDEPVIHRDLKPANILIHKTVAKIADFGIAKVTTLKSTGADSGAQGVGEGTALTMSPEQANGETVDHRSDLYGLGCVLFMMATGRGPFTGNQIAILYQHCTAEPTPPSKLVPDIPPALDKIILRLLEKEPDRRYSSAADVLVDLAKVYAPEMAPQPSRRWPMAVAAAATVIATVALIRILNPDDVVPDTNPFALQFVNSGDWEAGAMYYVKEPKVRIVGTAGSEATIEVIVPSQSGRKPYSISADADGRVVGDIELDVAESAENLQTFQIALSEKGGSPEPFEFEVGYDSDDPSIEVLTHGGRREKLVTDIEMLSGGLLEFVVFDAQSGLATDVDGKVRKRWQGQPKDESPFPNVRIFWSEGGLKIRVLDRAGRGKNAFYRVHKQLPTIIDVKDAYAIDGRHALKVKLECTGYDLQKNPLPKGKLFAVVATQRTELVFADGFYQADLGLPAPQGDVLSRHEVTFVYNQEPLAGKATVIHDVAPPVITLNYSGKPSATLTSNGAVASQPLVLPQGLALSERFSLSVSDDDAIGKVTVRYADGEAVVVSVATDGSFPLPASTPSGQSEYDVVVTAHDRASNQARLKFRVKRLGVSISSITALERAPQDGVIWVSQPSGLPVRVAATNVPQGGKLVAQLEDQSGNKLGEAKEFGLDGKIWSIDGLDLEDGGTGVARRVLRVLLKPAQGPNIELARYELALDSIKPQWTTTLLGEERTNLGKELTTGAFHPLVIRARDKGGIQVTVEDVDIRRLDGDGSPPIATLEPVEDGVDVKIAASGPNRKGRYLIQFTAKDRAGNPSRPFALTVVVVPPRLALQRVGETKVTRPEQFKEFGIPTRNDRLKVVVRNLAEGAKGSYEVWANMSVDGVPVESQQLEGLVEADRTQPFTIIVKGRRARIGLQWSERVGTVLSKGIVFDTVSWFQDQDEPTFEVLRDGVPLQRDLATLQANGVRVQGLERLALRIRDAGGFPPAPIKEKREFPEHETPTTDPTEITWRFSPEDAWTRVEIDIDVHDRAGNVQKIAFPIIRAKDYPEIDVFSDANGPIPRLRDDRHISRATSFQLRLKNDAVDVEQVRLEVLDRSDKKVYGRDLDLDPSTGARFIADFEVPGDGVYRVRLLARKRASGLDSDAFATRLLVVDTVAPTLSLLANGRAVSGAVTVKELKGWVVDVKDDNPPLEISYTLGSTASWSSLSAESSAGRYEIPDRPLAAGRYQLQVRAVDAAGNRGDKECTVVVDKPVVPTVTFSAEKIRRATLLQAVPIPDQGPPRFYMSKHEVSIGTAKKFIAFWRKQGSGFPEELQRRAKDDRNASKQLRRTRSRLTGELLEVWAKRNQDVEGDAEPARCFTDAIAVAVAVWAGGRVPTLDEWRGAAGRYLRPNAEYPVYISGSGAVSSSVGTVKRQRGWAYLNRRRYRKVTELDPGSPYGLKGVPGNLREWVYDGLIFGTMGGCVTDKADGRNGPKLNRKPMKQDNEDPEACRNCGLRVLWPVGGK
ncbi:MAG: hypothetical protein CMJ83_11545 [Planctomycetes bacterium]|nr:hypothetical protein [Planctomycetota bacterium]